MRSGLKLGGTLQPSVTYFLSNLLHVCLIHWALNTLVKECHNYIGIVFLFHWRKKGHSHETSFSNENVSKLSLILVFDESGEFPLPTKINLPFVLKLKKCASLFVILYWRSMLLLIFLEMYFWATHFLPFAFHLVAPLLYFPVLNNKWKSALFILRLNKLRGKREI